MCILNGFPRALKSTTSFPFGIWFANAHTLYVADEGNKTTAATVETFYNPAAAQTTAGLQKWIYVADKWRLAYTLTAGLDLGVPYRFPATPPATIRERAVQDSPGPLRPTGSQYRGDRQ